MNRKAIFFSLLCLVIVLSSVSVLSTDAHAFGGNDCYKSLLFADSTPPPRTVPPPVKVPPPVTVPPPKTVPPPVTVPPPKTVPSPVTVPGVSLPSTTPGGESAFSGLSAEEQKGLLDAIKRFSAGDPKALSDIMKYTKNIPGGMYVFGQGSGGIGAGLSGAQVKLDFLSAGMKIKKNHDGSVEIELAGQLGIKPGAEVAVGVSGGGGLRAGASVKIKEDGTLIFGQKIGAGAGGEGTAKTPGAGVFGKYGVDVSAMGGWELEMSAEAYARLTPWQKSWMSNPAYAAYLAKTNEDIGLYITTEIKTSHGGSAGGHGGAGWGPQGGFEAGVGWESEGTNYIPKGWDRIHLLWYWENGHHHPYLIAIVTIHYDQPEVTA